MRETIVVAPGLGEYELVRSLARHGVDTFNFRVCGPGDLAQLALMRSGVHVAEEILTTSEEVALVGAAMEGEEYFEVPLSDTARRGQGDDRSVSYTDIQNAARALRTARCLVAGENEQEAFEEALLKGQFENKNQALICVYRKYMDALHSKGAIDNVMLVRRAIAECKPVPADFITLEEYPLDPLAQALVDVAAAGNASKGKISDLYNVQICKKAQVSFKKCYGASSEVDSILDDAYSSGGLDTCTVAVADTATYAQLFFDNMLLHDTPVTFGCGIPIVNSNPARLLKLYHRWSTSGFFGTASLHTMLYSDAFSRTKLEKALPEERFEEFSFQELYEIAGELRLGTDLDTSLHRIERFEKAARVDAELEGDKSNWNSDSIRSKPLYGPFLKALAHELALPAEDFVSKYARIRTGTGVASELLKALDASAVRVVHDELVAARLVGIETPTEEVVQGILGRSICNQSSAGGKLHITSIDKAFATMREHLYIAGLSASNYPGKPRENYLLLDDDLRHFDGAVHLLSDERITRRRENLVSLVNLARNLGSDVHVSYAYFDTSELKDDNASSTIYDLYRRVVDEKATIQALEQLLEENEVGYFDARVSPTRLIGSAYNAGKQVASDNPVPAGDPTPVPVPLNENGYSPTRLDAFFGCPRKFMLDKVLHISEPAGEEDVSFDVISPAAAGSLAHSLMERLADEPPVRDAFLVAAGEYFDRYLVQHVPVIDGLEGTAKDEFVKMMATAYGMVDLDRKVELKEEDINAEHPSGVKLRGLPDRVEQLEDGRCRVVDYKTGRKVKHKPDDIETCLQVLVYAFLMEFAGYDVADAEYKYLRHGRNVPCKYDDEMKQQLADKLTAFKEAMAAGLFPIADKETRDDKMKKPCQYCAYETICGKQDEEKAVA